MKLYSPKTLIKYNYADTLKTDWISNEFIYKNSVLLSITQCELFFNPKVDKPYINIYNLSEEFIEITLPFIELKHITKFDKQNYEYQTEVTKYNKITKYIKSTKLNSDIVCITNSTQSELKFGTTQDFLVSNDITTQLQYINNHYKLSHSVYEAVYVEQDNKLQYTHILNNNNFTLNILNEDHKQSFVINLPLQYTCEINYKQYQDLTNI